jgi:urate oxidase/2-oxo-4-hydroxy-4-carboxy-5-ureidoimidazoline decarboxylase
MHQFASGFQRNYYGKGEVTVYRLNGGIFGANVTMLLYGDAFWPTYTTGDNTGLVATDSMKNFIQRETANYCGSDLESYCRFLAEKFLVTYPQTGGIQITAAEIPYDGDDVFTPAGPDRATARIEMTAAGIVEVRSGIRGFKLLRLGGSAFYGFVRDQYTTLPETHNRPLHMWLDLEWLYTRPEAAFQSGRVTSCVRELVSTVFRGFESGSIQQVIYQIGSKLLDELPELAEVTLEANNRTWDLAAESVYTDPRPPYGILGLTLRR